MVERNGVAALNRTLLTVLSAVIAALTSILLFLGGFLIQSMAELKVDVTAIKASLPHITATINQRLDRLEGRPRYPGETR
ncbi:MAG: hypothetical protein ACR2QF_06990 [Geminicoccaceae bacterium]